MLCKTKLPSSIERFIKGCTLAYGKVKMVVVDDKFYLETPSRDIYNTLTTDEVRDQTLDPKAPHLTPPEPLDSFPHSPTTFKNLKRKRSVAPVSKARLLKPRPPQTTTTRHSSPDGHGSEDWQRGTRAP
jgi:hypothetical protein